EGATAALERLTARGLVRQGAFLADAPHQQFVHIAVLDEIQRRQVHARRVPRSVTSAEQFSAFLLRRHHLHPEHRLVGPPGVLASLELLQGEDLPVRVWEPDLLPARVAGATGLSTPDALAALWQLFRAGLVTPDTFSAIVAGMTPPRRPHESGNLRRRRRGQARGVLPRLPVIGRWSALGDEERLSPEER